MQKAAASAADHVFLDLEDAVAPNQKVPSRKKIVEALNTLDWGKKVRCVRINDLTTQWAYEDIIEVVEGAHANLDTIMMTKVTSAADILFADKLLSMMEKKLGLKKRIGLEALIEEVEGMQNIDEIARCTPRLECLVFGMGDFSASMGVANHAIGGDSAYPGDIWHYARFRLVLACRAAGIDRSAFATVFNLSRQARGLVPAMTTSDTIEADAVFAGLSRPAALAEIRTLI